MSFLAQEQSVFSSVQIDGEEKGALDPYLFFLQNYKFVKFKLSRIHYQ